MGTGAITGYVDVAQLVLYAFWVFFVGLIFYLQRESKREGFPLETDLPNGEKVVTKGLIAMPKPKAFRMADGHEVLVPGAARPEPPLPAAPRPGWIGAPLVPTGDPMTAGVGPGAYALREDEPDRATDGSPVIRPLRAAPDYSVSPNDTDPRGLPVIGADGETAGTVTDLWLDRVEMIVRYLELKTNGERSVLLPIQFARIKSGMRRDPHVKVQSLLGGQFEKVPGLKSGDQITKLEEDKVCAYYGAGTLYATPTRAEPLV